MASDLRSQLKDVAEDIRGEGRKPDAVTVRYRAALLRRGARLALESLPCICDQPQLEPEYRGYICRRCQALSSLSSEGKGG